MQGCSDAGVHWDAGVINRVCGVSVSAKHPNREMAVDGEKGKRARTPQEYQDAWVSSLSRAVERSRQQVTEGAL